MRQTGLRETIISASDPATMMERVLAGALVLVPSADGAVIGLCADTDSLDFPGGERQAGRFGRLSTFPRQQPLGSRDQERRHSALPIRSEGPARRRPYSWPKSASCR